VNKKKAESKALDESDDAAGGFDDDALIRVIAALEKDYRNGDKETLIVALSFCCHLQQCAMPKWVADEVKRALSDWSEFKVERLDEAFCVTRPKGFRLNAHRKKHEKKYKVYCRVNQLVEMGEAKGDELFAAVGKEEDISGSTAKNYYYEEKNIYKNFFKYKGPSF
jgi:hypothetical protein